MMVRETNGVLNETDMHRLLADGLAGRRSPGRPAGSGPRRGWRRSSPRTEGRRRRGRTGGRQTGEGDGDREHAVAGGQQDSAEAADEIGRDPALECGLGGDVGRRAIEYGVSKAALLKLFGGSDAGQIVRTTIPPGSAGYAGDDPYPTPGDRGSPARCRAGLAAAGHRNGLT